MTQSTNSDERQELIALIKRYENTDAEVLADELLSIIDRRCTEAAKVAYFKGCLDARAELNNNGESK